MLKLKNLQVNYYIDGIVCDLRCRRKGEPSCCELHAKNYYGDGEIEELTKNNLPMREKIRAILNTGCYNNGCRIERKYRPVKCREGLCYSMPGVAG